MARELKFDEIADILLSKTNLESDPTLPKFRDWLLSLGAAEYLPKFLEAGFDLPYISSKGLSYGSWGSTTLAVRTTRRATRTTRTTTMMMKMTTMTMTMTNRLYPSAQHSFVVPSIECNPM